jgi:hypothetical protein
MPEATMTRRTIRLLVVILTLGVLILMGPPAAEAQPAGRIARIGVLDLGHSSSAAVELQRAFRQALGELGWVEGYNPALVRAFFTSVRNEADRVG